MVELVLRFSVCGLRFAQAWRAERHSICFAFQALLLYQSSSQELARTLSRQELKAIRERLALSQEALGQALRPNEPLSQESISQYESGTTPTPDWMIDKARELEKQNKSSGALLATLVQTANRTPKTEAPTQPSNGARLAMEKKGDQVIRGLGEQEVRGNLLGAETNFFKRYFSESAFVSETRHRIQDFNPGKLAFGIVIRGYSFGQVLGGYLSLFKANVERIDLWIIGDSHF